MQIFELHFNPKLKKDQFFDSFAYEPENAYEKRLGSLFIIGELKNALPQNSKFLDKLAKFIKGKYYSIAAKSLESALSQSLKKTNEFLGEEIKNDNVSWMGNLNFGIIAIKDYNLIFTKTGELKVLLLRSGQAIDMGKNLDLQEINPYPVKIFFNTVTGKLAKNDLVLILTKELYDFFLQENLINKIASSETIDEKKIKELLPQQLFTKGKGATTSGVCFLALVKPKENKNASTMVFENAKTFSWTQVFSPLFSPFKKLRIKFKRPVKSGKKLLPVKKTKLKINLPKPANPLCLINRVIGLKKLFLIFFLLILLFLGFLIFKGKEQKKQIKTQDLLNEIKEEVALAENYVIFKKKKEANLAFKEALAKLQPLTEVETRLESKILSLELLIKQNLEDLNSLERIEDPELLFKLGQEEIGFLPKTILRIGSSFYFHSPSSNNIYAYKKEMATSNKPLALSVPQQSSILFFSPEDSVLSFKEDNWEEKHLALPFENVDFTALSSYWSNLYFLDSRNCEIIKYSFLKTKEWGFPKIWLKDKIEDCSQIKDMAVDGSVWLLNNNTINKYHNGLFQETISLDIFPFPENITKIKTKAGIPYLYLLEPIKNRIIIIEKDGTIFKQIQSEKFNSLKDFIISEDGKIIWLLNNFEVYKIEL